MARGGGGGGGWYWPRLGSRVSNVFGSGRYLENYSSAALAYRGPSDLATVHASPFQPLLHIFNLVMFMITL